MDQTTFMVLVCTDSATKIPREVTHEQARALMGQFTVLNEDGTPYEPPAAEEPVDDAAESSAAAPTKKTARKR